MKRLSISLPATTLALVLALSGAALTPLSSAADHTAVKKAVPASPAKSSFQYMYYWYVEPDDYYNDWTTLAYEEWEWWVYLGGIPVDTNPAGGTLIAEGYMDNYYPHLYPPAAYLYAHFPYNPSLTKRIRALVQQALTPSKP